MISKAHLKPLPKNPTKWSDHGGKNWHKKRHVIGTGTSSMLPSCRTEKEKLVTKAFYRPQQTKKFGRMSWAASMCNQKLVAFWQKIEFESTILSLASIYKKTKTSIFAKNTTFGSPKSE